MDVFEQAIIDVVDGDYPPKPNTRTFDVFSTEERPHCCDGQQWYCGWCKRGSGPDTLKEVNPDLSPNPDPDNMTIDENTPSWVLEEVHYQNMVDQEYIRDRMHVEDIFSQNIGDPYVFEIVLEQPPEYSSPTRVIILDTPESPEPSAELLEMEVLTLQETPPRCDSETPPRRVLRSRAPRPYVLSIEHTAQWKIERTMQANLQREEREESPEEFPGLEEEPEEITDDDDDDDDVIFVSESRVANSSFISQKAAGPDSCNKLSSPELLVDEPWVSRDDPEESEDCESVILSDTTESVVSDLYEEPVSHKKGARRTSTNALKESSDTEFEPEEDLQLEPESESSDSDFERPVRSTRSNTGSNKRKRSATKWNSTIKVKPKPAPKPSTGGRSVGKSDTCTRKYGKRKRVDTSSEEEEFTPVPKRARGQKYGAN
ncbi:hypothetical protein EDC01DRAFT_783736 [Geopyxis carbonaria]|nr:hypothetical protein EDC01DRAFT_783736 [Geopyxis carbonaria]